MATRPEPENTSDPRVHARNIAAKLDELTQHLQADVQRIEDESARALFETAREVLLGLKAAFDHLQRRSEDAWREPAPSTH